MNCIRSLAIGTILTFTLSLAAQQPTTSPGAHQGVPSVEQHMKVLTARLDLSTDQQEKIRPILQQLHDGTEKVVSDPTLSHEGRMAQMRPLRYKADKDMREVLNDDQKKKLDQLEQDSHRELHGSVE